MTQSNSVELLVWQSKTHFEAGRFQEAAAALRRALELQPPEPAVCYNNLGVIYHHLRDWKGATEAFGRAVAARPDYASAHKNLGDALERMGRYEAAVASYQTALRQQPNMAEAHAGLGLVLSHQSQFRPAIEHLRTAVNLNPGDIASQANLSLCHGRLAEHEAAMAAARRALQIDPSDAQMHSSLIALMNYTTAGNPQAMLEESLIAEQQHFRGLAHWCGDYPNKPEVDRPLRIGYVSPDFREHAVAYFLEPLLAGQDKERFVLYGYSDVARPDAFTARMKSSMSVWRDIHGRGHEEVARQIREDGIDILIDMAGHSVDNRLPVFARKPAPVQASWLGYLNTTGLRTIDYRITDAWSDPAGVSEGWYTEKLVRLPDAFFVYQPPPEAGAVGALPMLERGHVTFASFNNFTKITADLLKLWGRILRSIPNSRLMMSRVAPEAIATVKALMKENGVSADKIEFVGKTADFAQSLERHNQVDIGLDTFPWTGHTTTCHSLWMGVPVVSLAGQSAITRAGMSIMGNLGMEKDWVAENPEDYVRLAVEWANKPKELSVLRGALRGRMAGSALTDAARFTLNFENALRGMWRDWCAAKRGGE